MLSFVSGQAGSEATPLVKGFQTIANEVLCHIAEGHISLLGTTSSALEGQSGLYHGAIRRHVLEGKLVYIKAQSEDLHDIMAGQKDCHRLLSIKTRCSHTYAGLQAIKSILQIIGDAFFEDCVKQF